MHLNPSQQSSQCCDDVNVIINTPGGTFDFGVPIMKVNSYSLAQIFEKDLCFLLPFYDYHSDPDFGVIIHGKISRIRSLFSVIVLMASVISVS